MTWFWSLFGWRYLATERNTLWYRGIDIGDERMKFILDVMHDAKSGNCAHHFVIDINPPVNK